MARDDSNMFPEWSSIVFGLTFLYFWIPVHLMCLQWSHTSIYECFKTHIWLQNIRNICIVSIPFSDFLTIFYSSQLYTYFSLVKKGLLSLSAQLRKEDAQFSKSLESYWHNYVGFYYMAVILTECLDALRVRHTAGFSGLKCGFTVHLKKQLLTLSLLWM